MNNAHSHRSLLEACAIHKRYGRGTAALDVLRGINLTVAAGELIAIVGRSGAGKSTLLHILGGLDLPTAGIVRVIGRDLYAMRDAQRARVRNQTIGFVFQFYHLLPELTALENVMLPALMQRYRQRRVVRQQAETQLARVGLQDRLTHRPSELSGGELQRAAIARALINEPTLLLCDEPTGNLDSDTGAGIMELLVGLRVTGKRAVVLVSHDTTLAQQADRMIHIQDGRIVEAGQVLAS